jgi:hypothetical protein
MAGEVELIDGVRSGKKIALGYEEQFAETFERRIPYRSCEVSEDEKTKPYINIRIKSETKKLH